MCVALLLGPGVPGLLAAEPLPPWSGVGLPSERVADALHVRGRLLLATPRGVYLLSAPAVSEAGGQGSSGERSVGPQGVSHDAPAGSSPSGALSMPDGLAASGGTAIWAALLGRVGEAHQLAAREGQVWIATEGGLWSWDLSGRPVRAPELGAPVRAVAVGPRGRVWASSPSGLFVRSAGQPAWRRSRALPERDIAALKAATGPDPELWAASAGSLWRLEGDRFQRVLGGLSDGWWELEGVARVGSETWVGVPEGVWVVREGKAERRTLGAGAITDLASVAGAGIALLRDGRLLCARAQSPVSPEALPDSGRILALGHSDALGLLALRPRGVRRVVCLEPAAVAAEGEALAGPRVVSGAPGPVARKAGRDLPSSAQVDRLHRLVLEYLDLSPQPMQRLERRARHRGLWPELRVGMGMDSRRARALDRDQTFSSGEVRDLLDQARDRQRDSALEVQLVWKLGETTDPSDLLAISKERRERIELREQVLERVDQIFFERARVQARLARDPDLSEAERLELRIRARELAASLDAWTGGLFSRNGPGGLGTAVGSGER